MSGGFNFNRSPGLPGTPEWEAYFAGFSESMNNLGQRISDRVTGLINGEAVQGNDPMGDPNGILNSVMDALTKDNYPKAAPQPPPAFGGGGDAGPNLQAAAPGGLNNINVDDNVGENDAAEKDNQILMFAVRDASGEDNDGVKEHGSLNMGSSIISQPSQPKRVRFSDPAELETQTLYRSPASSVTSTSTSLEPRAVPPAKSSIETVCGTAATCVLSQHTLNMVSESGATMRLEGNRILISSNNPAAPSNSFRLLQDDRTTRVMGEGFLLTIGSPAGTSPSRITANQNNDGELEITLPE